MHEPVSGSPPDALGTEDIIEGSGELGIPVSNEEPGRAEVGGHSEVAGLLGDPVGAEYSSGALTWGFALA